MNGRVLPPEHGFPLRLVVPGWYGMASVKWLAGIDFLAEPFDGFFQTNHYVYRGEEGTPEGTPVREMRVRSLITSPLAGERLARAPIQIHGRAWTGNGVVEGVEVSIGGGTRWDDAAMGKVLARDSEGNVQPLAQRWNEGGYGNNGVQVVDVIIV